MRSASECVRRSHRQCLRRPTHSDAERTCRASGRLNFHSHIGRDKTVLSVSCLVCRCELDDCCERVQTSNFLSATVLSCRGSNSHRRDGRDTDKTVLSCLAWRCELALTNTTRTTRPCVRRVPHIAGDKKGSWCIVRVVAGERKRRNAAVSLAIRHLRIGSVFL